MDTIYYRVFHKLIDYSVQHQDLRILVPYVPTFVAKRETILKRGGWRDLSYLEDNEMNARVGFDIVAPIIIGENAYVSGFSVIGSSRERRYGNFIRITRTQIDRLRAQAISWYRLIVTKDYPGMVFYPFARLVGFYRNRFPDNSTWIELAVLVKSVSPRDLDIDEKYFCLVMSRPLISLVKGGEKAIENKIRTLISPPLIKIYLRGKNKRLCYIKDRTLIDRNIISNIKQVKIIW